MPASPTHAVSPTKSVDNRSVDSNISAMLELKNGRKRAETDLQLLSNRIALLRNEEQRAMNKITETKHRAKEILVMKKKNEDVVRARTAKMMSGDEKSRAAKDKVTKAKRDREARLMNSKAIIEENRKRIADSVKEETIRNEEVNKKNKESIEALRRKKAMEGQKRKDAIRKQRERERAEKEREAQLAYAKKMADEAKKTKEAEDLIAQLEKEEIALIERLKRTQTLQEKAYQTLQSSLEL